MNGTRHGVLKYSGIALLILVLSLASCGDKITNSMVAEHTAPGLPTDVEATSADSQATITWRPASNATSYNIYWRSSSGVTTTDNVIVNASSPYVHQGLTNGQTYFYVVTGVNSEGESPTSPEVSATPVSAFTAPDAPVNVQLTSGDGELTLSWNPVANATSYNIYWSLNSGVSTSSNKIASAQSSYAHSGLTNNNTYYYRISAVNSLGESSLSTEISGQPRALFSRENKLVTSPTETYASFGGSVSISGDYAIVGAYGEDDGVNTDAGAAYIFYRTGLDTWDSGTKITAPDRETGAWFGNSVSISGDYAIVGACMKTEGGYTQAGAAYIFRRTGSNTWDSGTKIAAPDLEVGARFGNSVSISGDYAIVGAYGKDGGVGLEVGEAYIFHRTGLNTWDSGTKIASPVAWSFGMFGYSVSISGDYAIVGAPNTDWNGASYIFHRTGPNTWDSGTKIVAADPEAFAYFGSSVSLSGDYAIVGAYGKTEGGYTRAGAVYLFHRAGPNTWGSSTKITASDPEADARFGYSVSISGDHAIVGAMLKDEGGSADTGAAYIFQKTGTNAWDSGSKHTASDLEANAYFGESVSISGDHVIGGASLKDEGGNANAGAAYIY